MFYVIVGFLSRCIIICSEFYCLLTCFLPGRMIVPSINLTFVISLSGLIGFLRPLFQFNFVAASSEAAEMKRLLLEGYQIWNATKNY